ncbi:MAG: hypothetical protein P8016_14905 [Sedimentisphaerales bacterium]
MSTEAQIKANRENAKKSTGPRTARGKEVVSQNALRHGLCAKKNLIRTESQEEFDLFRDVMLDDLAPSGGMELMLAQRIVALSWRLRRAEHFQNVLVDALIDFSMQDCRSRIDNAQEEARAGNFDLITGYALKRDFADARSLDLLLSYERRIESSLYKATDEFRKTQKLRKEKQSQSAGFQPEILKRAAEVDLTGPASSNDTCGTSFAMTNKANSDKDTDQRMQETAETKGENEFAEQSQFSVEKADSAMRT